LGARVSWNLFVKRLRGFRDIYRLIYLAKGQKKLGEIEPEIRDLETASFPVRELVS
jgi:hypothetical protein